jgi:uncharacterized membrane protein YvbJ
LFSTKPLKVVSSSGFITIFLPVTIGNKRLTALPIKRSVVDKLKQAVEKSRGEQISKLCHHHVNRLEHYLLYFDSYLRFQKNPLDCFQLSL